MNTVLLIAPSIAYFVALGLLLQRILRRRTAHTMRAEAHGDKPFGLAMVTVTLVATVIGPADTLALADQGRTYGLFFLVFPLFAAAQHLVTGIFFADKLNREAKQCLTIGEIMGRYYNKPAQVLTGAIVAVQALAFTGILCLAAGQILQAFFNLPPSYGIVGTALFVGLYTTFGGMNAVVFTDKIQFAVQVALGVTATITAGVIVFGKASPVPLSWWAPDYTEYTTSKIIIVAISYFLGEALLPVYAVRGMISASPDAAKRAFKITAGLIAVWYVMMSVVGVAAQRVPGSPSGTKFALVDVVAFAIANPIARAFAVGLVLAGLFGIIHSTLDAILNAGATSVTRDVLGSFVSLSDKDEVGFLHRVALLIAVFGTIFSIAKTNLIDALLVGYAVWVPTMVFPLAYALIRKDRVRRRSSALIGVVAGGVGYFVGEAAALPWMPGILLGLLVNALAVSISEITSHPPVAQPEPGAVT